MAQPLGIRAVPSLVARRARALRHLILVLAALAATTALPAAAQISPEEYADRRSALLENVDEGVVLVLGSPEPAADYLPFSQRPDFRYLTGILEPGAALLLVREDGRRSGTVFVLPRDPARETWEGIRLGTRGAESLTGLPARERGELDAVLDSLLARGLPLRVSAEVDLRPGRALGTEHQLFVDELRSRNPEVEVASAEETLARLRGTKSPAELEALRTAVQITVRAHEEVLRLIEPGMNEFEVQALIEYTFRRSGAERPGFASIVGSGPNSTTLHYNANDRVMREGDLVVMDIGALWGGYTADVTRTVPVSGTFTEDQAAVYRVVRAAQEAAEREAVLGAPAGNMSREAATVVAEGLARLGLITGPGDDYDCGEDRRCPQYRLYYMHGLGHGIGLEVHDPDRYYFPPNTIGPGSAFSIEPGIYVRENLLDIIPDTPANREMKERIAPAVRRYANIGVRIEDDYLVTEDGVEWVSSAPREIDEIERAMAEPWTGPAPRDRELVERYPGG